MPYFSFSIKIVLMDKGKKNGKKFGYFLPILLDLVVLDVDWHYLYTHL